MRKYTPRSLATKLATLLLTLSLLFPLIAAPIKAAETRPDPIHPLLAKMVDENPSGTVRVIVQGNNPNGELSAQIDRHEGKNKKLLPMVRGIAAEMPAGRVRALSRNPNVQWVTVDAEMVTTVNITNLGTIYPLAVNADKVWNGTRPYTGTGVGVAVVDSGINNTGATNGKDFGNRIVAKVNMTTGADLDKYGHGTHVAGIIANSGAGSRGKYIGIAPNAKLVNVKVSNDVGLAYVSDVVRALQWVFENRAKYNIRVVNLSLVQTVAESYKTSPLDAAVERLWLSGIVVVVASGNTGPDTMLYPPANDPFVITVGAADSNGTVGISDDLIPSWSGYGTTQDGFSKPEVVAPGRQIVSNLALSDAVLALLFPDRIVDKNYIRLSGTSMAAPVVSGIAALAFEAHPGWTPDQFKWALMATARPLAGAGAGRGEVDAAVVEIASPGYANTGVAFNNDVATAAGSATYDAATWNAATWNAATWNAATWNSATWNAATWNSATWTVRVTSTPFPD